MAFGHEQLDVYRAAIKYVGWAYSVKEEPAEYQIETVDTDADSDPE